MATMDIKTTKGKVEWCLKNRPATREDDTLLVLSVWKNFHRSDFIDLLKLSLQALEIEQPFDIKNFKGGDMKQLPSFESCRRVRQKFNENGEFLPSDEVMKKRGRTVGRVQSDLIDF